MKAINKEDLLKEYCDIRDGLKTTSQDELIKWQSELEKDYTWCCKNIIECIIELIKS